MSLAFRRLALTLLLLNAPSLAAPRLAAQEAAAKVTQIAPKFFLISNTGGNLLLMTGEDASFVVGIQQPALVQQAVATVTAQKAKPVKFVLLVDDEHAPDYGDGGWGARGAVTIAQELLGSRLHKPDQTAPMMGFSQVVQLHLRGEDTHLIHDRAGYSDADTAIHFEHSGVAYLGPAFTSDGYPRIDAAHGGKLSGMIETVNFFATNFAGAPQAIEPIVPGRGPVATIRDLGAYRDMLRSVGDRVRTAARGGKSVQDVIASKPTAEFDARWGHGPVTPDQFVAMVYASVTKD
jgi:cyclase